MIRLAGSLQLVSPPDGDDSSPPDGDSPATIRTVLRATLDPGDAEATRLVWDPLGTSGYVDVLAETDAAEALVREYWRAARLAVFKSPSTKGAYLFDHLGNTEGVLNSAQNFAVGYLYSAWGEGLKTTGGLEQAWQFGGDWGAWRDVRCTPKAFSRVTVDAGRT